MTAEMAPEVVEFLRMSKVTLVSIMSMNRAQRRMAGWTRPVSHYQTQLTRVLRDLGEIV